MQRPNLARAIAVVGFSAAAAISAVHPAEDPLPSWNDGANKQAIIEFVTAVTTEGGPDFVAVDDRIATFDNDGTLWSEQPMYVQLAFALDEIKAMAPQHPEWKATQPFKAVPENHLGAFDRSSGDTAELMIRAFHDDARRGYAVGPAHGLPNTPFDPFSQIRDGRSASEKLARRKHEWRLASHRSLS